MDKYRVVGVMSGTSLDGVDIAYCEFSKNDTDKWNYKIKLAKTYEYNDEWRHLLGNGEKASGASLVTLHKKYGHYIAGLINDFINGNKLAVDFISSHGHTILHQPDKGLTFQIGEGASIAAGTGLKVVCDFRTTDVALGGQGAPLVPVGDKILFPEYGYCLNLGGFANISFDKGNKRVAYDICPVNTILNRLSYEYGILYDDKGEIASRGKLDTALYKELNSLDYYKKSYPKSLSKEWLNEFFLPIVLRYDIPVDDKLRTITEHIAFQISKSVNIKLTASKSKLIFITGGGAYNEFLIQCIKRNTKLKCIIPNKKTIEFKEALIFAFLGVLRMRNEVNCLSSVTGASRDSVCGAVYN